MEVVRIGLFSLHFKIHYLVNTSDRQAFDEGQSQYSQAEELSGRGADDPIIMSQKLYHSRFWRFFDLGSNSRSPGCRVESLPQETIGGNQETSHPPISH